MIKIGLTGGIASGKTRVASWFAQKGIPVFNADDAVHRLYDGPLIPLIGKEFGSECVRDGKIDRAELGKIIFADPEARQRLEELVHPLIRQQMQDQCLKAEIQSEKLIILDIPLLLETGWGEFVDEVWVVYVPAEIQITRLMERSGLTREEAERRLAAQMPLEDKKGKADRVIDNSRDWGETEKQLETIWKELFS
ncbi:MAG: dephospho-CoA kinase [Dehalobacter sp. 4CP]|uniref:dephospho-CoA kinase n=1 Tax=Dehalobacter sp. CP TaxID=2594474 RepID=UPI0013CBB8AE|nr:dephospho-CoA kinase [Dehalobacter sp. 4CP]